MQNYRNVNAPYNILCYCELGSHVDDTKLSPFIFFYLSKYIIYSALPNDIIKQ